MDDFTAQVLEGVIPDLLCLGFQVKRIVFFACSKALIL